MRRRTPFRNGCLLGVILLGTAVVLVPWQGMIWDGRFPNVECRLRFVDGSGNPVPGVTLTVLGEDGSVSHGYPIDEFDSDQSVVSDANGQMTFHHASHGLEFGGREYRNLIGMRFGTTSSPKFECVFTHHGQEVFRTPYNFHRHAWDEFRKESVTRDWPSPQEEKRRATAFDVVERTIVIPNP